VAVRTAFPARPEESEVTSAAFVLNVEASFRDVKVERTLFSTAENSS